MKLSGVQKRFKVGQHKTPAGLDGQIIDGSAIEGEVQRLPEYPNLLAFSDEELAEAEARSREKKPCRDDTVMYLWGSDGNEETSKEEAAV